MAVLFVGPKKSHMRKGSASSALIAAGKACMTANFGSPVGCVTSARRTASTGSSAAAAALPAETEADEDMLLLLLLPALAAERPIEREARSRRRLSEDATKFVRLPQNAKRDAPFVTRASASFACFCGAGRVLRRGCGSGLSLHLVGRAAVVSR